MDVNNFSQFILEKRIGQISSMIEVTFGFDVITTTHTKDRLKFSERGLKGDNQSDISNAEMLELVLLFRRDISESIISGDIEHGTQFVVKSLDRSLSLALIAEKELGTYWKIIIKTVFRESDYNTLYTSKDQLVFEK